MKRKATMLLALSLALMLTLGSALALAEGTAPSKITGFLHESGQNFPDDFDPVNNWFMQEICRLANIEWEDLIWPATFSDAETKFNLMMASGDIPDVFWMGFKRPDIRRYGDEGAFVPLQDYIAGSETVNRWFTPMQIDMMKSDTDENTYVLDSVGASEDFNGIYLRMDLLEKAGVDEVPKTLDEFVDALRAVKAYNPDSLPYVCRGVEYQEWFMFAPFNTDKADWRYYQERGTVCNNWEGDNILKAVEFARTLYSEGLLDKEFITNSGTDVNNKRLRDDCLIWAQNRGGIIARMEMLAADGQDEARLIPVVLPVAEGVGIDEITMGPAVRGGYNFAISAACEDPDAAWRFIETMFSDEIYDLSIYGREGIEYEEIGGVKTPIFPAVADTAWRECYTPAFMNNGDVLDYITRCAIYATNLPEEEKQAYDAWFNEGTAAVVESMCYKQDYNPMEFISSVPDEILNARNEAIAEQKSIVAQAIIGEISMEDFAAQKDRIVEKYQHVTDFYNQEVERVKAEYDLTYTR